MLIFSSTVASAGGSIAVTMIMTMSAEFRLMSKVEVAGCIMAHLEPTFIAPVPLVGTHVEASPERRSHTIVILVILTEVVVANTKSHVASAVT